MDSSIAVMGRGVELGLLVDRQVVDLVGLEEMVASQVREISHSVNARLGHVDRLQPDAQLFGVETAEPLAGGPAVAGAARGTGHVLARFDARVVRVGDIRIWFPNTLFGRDEARV